MKFVRHEKYYYLTSTFLPRLWGTQYPVKRRVFLVNFVSFLTVTCFIFAVFSLVPNFKLGITHYLARDVGRKTTSLSLAHV